MLKAIGDFFSSGLLVFLFVLIPIVFLVIMKVISSRYKKFGPGEMGIFYGRKYKQKMPDGTIQELGLKVVVGGGKILIPFVENYARMSTLPFQVPIQETGIPNKDNVRVNVKGVATCKISTQPDDVINAAQSFVGKNDADVKSFVENILKGHLRSIVGKLDINSILRERENFNKQVREESSVELKGLGIQMITLVIQDVDDEYGYIESLGKQAVAEVKRDADIKVAEAEKESAIKVSNAKRESAIVQAENDAKTAEADKERDVKKAQYKVVSDTEMAKAEQAKNIALATQQKILKVAEADRDAAEKEAQIKVQKMEVERKATELIASIVKQAEAEKQGKIIQAEADKQEVILKAEAEAEKLRVRSEATKTSDIAIGVGEASRKLAVLQAEAVGEADKEKQKLLAQAEGKKQQLLAEAEGTEKLAQALGQMTDKAQLIIILDKLPVLIDKGGEAGAKVMQAIFQSVAAGIANVDNISIVDFGGNNGNGSGIGKMANLVPQMVFEFLAKAQAAGFDLTGLFSKLGINAEDSLKLLGKSVADNGSKVESALKPLDVENN